MSIALDVSQLTREAQPVAEAAARVYLKHTGPWFRGLIVHGSAFKGGFIPGCSDIDMHLYLEDSAFVDSHLPLGLSVNIHRDLAKIDPNPFSYIQCFALADALPEGWTRPIPGAYAIIAGHLPVPEATTEELLASARGRLSGLGPLPGYLQHSLLDHGAGRLGYKVRLLCTDVWPALHDILALRTGDPISSWNLSKTEAMAQLSEPSALADAIRRFHSEVLAYYPGESSVEQALQVIWEGVAFLGEAKSWWERSKSSYL